MSAQDRYETTLRTKILPDGRTVYASVRPKTVPEDIEDVRIVVDEQDRADIISNNVYSTVSDWWRIIAANKKFKGSLFFKPGQEIIIPKN